MDCRLEHFLLMAALAEELGCDGAELRMLLQASAVGFDLKLFFWRDLHRQPFTEIHFTGSAAPCCP